MVCRSSSARFAHRIGQEAGAAPARPESGKPVCQPIKRKGSHPLVSRCRWEPTTNFDAVSRTRPGQQLHDSEAADRAGRERLLRYCARPPFALDRPREPERPTVIAPSACSRGRPRTRNFRDGPERLELAESGLLSMTTYDALPAIGVAKFGRSLGKHPPRMDGPVPPPQPGCPESGAGKR